jgi:hypothetical protein
MRTTDLLDREVDFARFGPVRRDALAGADEPGGPSLLALWEMPQLSADAKPVRRGRTDPFVARTARLPAATWKRIERAAREQHIDVDRALQAAVREWLRRAG